MSLAMNNQTPEPAVDISDLWFSYNGHPVLKNVNLAVQQGDFMAVIGPNGGGKTTLIKLLLGLLTPVRGRVRVLGCHPKEAATKVGYVPQETGVRINAPVTVLNVVLMGRMKGWSGFRPYSKADRNAARSVMEHFRVWDFRHRRMNQLSGGQRQRVLVARALVGNPSLLLLDEPTANFDSQSQSEFYELLRIENQTKTIMVVSHDLMVLSSYIKSVACVSQQVHFHNRPEITQDMLQMAYHCPVELIAHGLPHRVLSLHKED